MPTREVRVPDLGDFGEVPVVEVLVGPGDAVREEQALVTLESDKATMDVPAPRDGIVKELNVQVGDRVSQGALLLSLDAADTPAPEVRAAGAPAGSAADGGAAPAAAHAVPPHPPSSRASPTARIAEPVVPPPARSHATPALRRFARTLGVDLSQVTGTGRKGRILEEDVKEFVKGRLAHPRDPEGGRLPVSAMPALDFSKFGEIEVRPLSRIKRVSGPHLHRAWIHVPHVTHHDEADVTELEKFRQSLKREATESGLRVTPLAFALKALARAVHDFPDFNASLSPDGRSLILKKYVNIGVAVDTPHGLVVPVLRAADTKGILGIADELGELGRRARENTLEAGDFQGGSITVSSLGGIGGSAFTPIVNAPEVAILGLARARMSPVWDGTAFQPRLMQPLDLSYDHRVIDGARAARFTRRLAELLQDLRRLLL